MIPDRDIWRAANLLIREYKADAEIVAARRVDDVLCERRDDQEEAWVQGGALGPRRVGLAPGAILNPVTFFQP